MISTIDYIHRLGHFNKLKYDLDFIIYKINYKPKPKITFNDLFNSLF